MKKKQCGEAGMTNFTGKILMALGVVFFIFSIGMTICDLTTEKEVKKVPCFDRHNNEMIGLQCETENNAYAGAADVSPFLIMCSAAIFFAGYIIDAMGDN